MPRNPDRDERLAAYLDGELSARDRSALEDDLASSEALREELRLARLGREAARGLPEVDPPPGTLQGVIRELDRGGIDAEEPLLEHAGADWAAGPRSPRGRASTRWRIFVGAAAASLVVAGGIVIGAQLGDDAQRASPASGAFESPADAGADAAESSGLDRPPSLEQSEQDFDAAALGALASESATAPQADGPIPDEQALRAFAPAIRCVEQWAASTDGGVPLRVIEATFEGRPAVIGVFRVDEPEPKIVVWAVRPSSCDVISVTSTGL